MSHVNKTFFFLSFAVVVVLLSTCHPCFLEACGPGIYCCVLPMFSDRTIQARPNTDKEDNEKYLGVFLSSDLPSSMK